MNVITIFHLFIHLLVYLLKIENDGNLVLYSQSGSVVWQSDTRCKHSKCNTNSRSSSADDYDEIAIHNILTDIHIHP